VHALWCFVYDRYFCDVPRTQVLCHCLSCCHPCMLRAAVSFPVHDDISHRTPYCAVTSYDRCDVAGVPLVASFGQVMTEAQRHWLSSTKLPLRTLVLHDEDEATSAMLQKVRRWPAKPAQLSALLQAASSDCCGQPVPR